MLISPIAGGKVASVMVGECCYACLQSEFMILKIDYWCNLKVGE